MMKTLLTMLWVMWRELMRSRWNTLFALLTVLAATAMVSAMMALGKASEDATRVMMKNMGFNLLITPQGMDSARYQMLDFQDADMPEEYVARLAGKNGLPAEHFVGKYQRTIDIGGDKAVLTGVLAEPAQGAMKPMPTAYEVPPGEAFAGGAIAQRLKLQAGQSLELLGKTFKVSRVLDGVGAIPDDIRIYIPLHDMQALVNKPGRINAIDALSCKCDVLLRDLIAVLKQRIQEVLPDVNVTAYDSILLARHQQRSMMTWLSLLTLSLVMAAAAAAIWGLTYQNVVARRYEIGVLRALGVPAWRIAALFLIKIAAYSAAGALAGCEAGYALAGYVNFTGAPIAVPPGFFLYMTAATPCIALLFGLPPVAGALALDPVDLLGDRGA